MLSREASSKRLDVILEAFKGTIMVLGLPDRGKTTLVRELCLFFLTQGKATTVIDADLGQSTVGPPTTIAARPLFQGWTPDDLLFTPHFHFIGETSPVRCPVRVATSTADLVRRAKNASDVVVVDTSGYLDCAGGRRLKTMKIGLCRPDMIIALGTAEEFRFLGPEAQEKTMVVPPLASSRQKSLAERRDRRYALFQRYFRHSERFVSSLSRVMKGLGDGYSCILNHWHASVPGSVQCPLEDGVRPRENTLCGLYNQEGSPLGLGVVRAVDEHRRLISIAGMRVDGGSVERIVPGGIRLDRLWREEGSSAGPHSATTKNRTFRLQGNGE